MTLKNINELQTKLTNAGYSKYNSCLSSTEDFGYFKSFAITYDEYGDKRVGYQIEFRFWDWTKYGRVDTTDENAYGVDIIIITSENSNRMDMIMTTDNYDIDNAEKIGEDFYKFCKEHNMI